MKTCLFLFLSLFALSSFGQSNSNTSLTISEYKKLGAPDPNSKWDDKDMQKALNVLSKLKEKHEKALPKTNNPTSGAYFKKLVAECSLHGLNGPHVTDKEKRSLIEKTGAFCKTLLNLYSTPDALIPYYSTEVAIVTNLAFENMHAEFIAFDTYVAQHPNLNEHQKIQVAQLKHGYHEMVVGLVANLGSAGVYKSTDLDILSATLRNSLRKDGKQLTLSAKTATRMNLMRIANNKVSATTKKNLNDASAAINSIH